MSATQMWLGPAAVNCRASRLGATGLPCWLSVVRGLRLRGGAANPSSRMSRATRPASTTDPVLTQRRMEPRTAVDPTPDLERVPNLLA